MGLRPYQEAARQAIHGEWDQGRRKTLLVLPTGTGKTVVFASVAADQVRAGERVLILAHRGELLEQAADKIASFTGLKCAVEKAEQTAMGEWYRITVGSVQTLMRDSRLQRFDPDYYGTIIIDEAHHALSDSYQRVLEHFADAHVLGVTATPDRGDMRNLGQYFDSLAYEYKLTTAIKEGYLCKIKAQTIPLKLDMSGVKTQAGDYSAADVGHALDPYLDKIADEMMNYCQGRKTVVFLPLIETSRRFCALLQERGFSAAEVNGDSADRAEILADFAAGRYDVLCNSMLLTEGWDCPSVDCIVVLRPTKIRSLYCLDEKTEVLTETGWKSDVEVGEKVAAFNPETSEIEFLPAIAKVRRPLNADEYFCSIKGPAVDIRVTDQHRMLYDNKRGKGWKFTTASHMASLRDGCRIPISGYGKFSGIPLTDDELRFIGWVMTDGSINKANNAVMISQGVHQPWCKDIQACIEGCGFKYNKFIRKRNSQFKSNSDACIWTISKGQPRGRDSHLRGWGALEPYLSKDFSLRLMDMTADQFEVLLEAIHLGDGSKQSGQDWIRRSYHISTGNRTFADRLQIAAVMRGYKANISELSNGANDRKIYIIHLKRKEYMNVGSVYDGRPIWQTEPHSDELCWCVENQLGTLVTRRNGKVTIVGNCQMVGRGTRLCEGKDHLLVLDFLWHTTRHELCRPACLICENPEVAQKMTENLEGEAEAVDLEEAEATAQADVIEQREAALAKMLEEQRHRKRALVDPLQFEYSIQAEDLASYEPSFPAEMAPPTKKQLELLERRGIFPDEISCFGKAQMIIDRLIKRQEDGLTTPKQIRLLEKYGFRHVGSWAFEDASKMISRIAACSWMVPRGIVASEWQPLKKERTEMQWTDTIS